MITLTNNRQGTPLYLLRLLTLVVVMYSWGSSDYQASADERLTDIMLSDPTLPSPERRLVLPDRLRRPWIAALRRSEPELQRIAADNIALAHRYGMRNWDEVIERLSELLTDKKTDATVRRAAANTLITIEARQTAQILHEVALGTQLDISQIVDPALARWDYKPARETWLARLENVSTTKARLLLAVEALGVVGEMRAVKPLLKRVEDTGEPPTIRLAATRSVARIEGAELVSNANQLSTSENHVERLLAAELLRYRTDDGAIEILKKLAGDPASTVAGIALRRLFVIDPELVYKFIDQSIAHEDVNVRFVGAEALVHQASPESIVKLATLLGDHNPGLRRYVSNSLIEMSKNESLHIKVVEVVIHAIETEDWRTLEQSAFIVGSIDIESSGERLIELLMHSRREVQTSSAWALRMILVEDLFVEMLNHAQQQYDLVSAKKPCNAGWDSQISQILQALGQARYEKADSLMRQLVPKDLAIQMSDSRAAAVWGLGYLYEGKSPGPLAAEIAGRLADTDSPTPESNPLRDICAISLGRMNAESQLPTLRKFAKFSGPAGRASRWAVTQMTGEPYKSDPDIIVENIDWFLAPVD